MTTLGAHSNRSCDFHAQHSPAGALASFTCGRIGASGGPGCELSGPSDGNIHVGYCDADGSLSLLPFMQMSDDEAARYFDNASQGDAHKLHCFQAQEITRDFGWGSDRWSAGDLSYEIFTPFGSLPDPAQATRDEQRDAFLPAIAMRLTVRNSTTATRKAFIAISPSRWLPCGPSLNGMYDRHGNGFASPSPGAVAFSNLSLASALSGAFPEDKFGLGPTAGVHLLLQPGEERSLDLVLGWYREGMVTIGKRMSYWYTSLFSGLDDVLTHALQRFSTMEQIARKRDHELLSSHLNEEQQFQIAHSTRSYYGSTQLLNDGGRPRWVVNEGEYLMMNTFDLTVDMAFFEMRYHPWALRNVLEQFAGEYNYVDEIYLPDTPEQLVSGGISFPHDMGVHNSWSATGHSSYEVHGLDRLCFSYMTCEELMNWVLCAGIYSSGTQDQDFLKHWQACLSACLESLQRRDDPEPSKRNGVMSWESSRCRGGGEITTYDSLDHSLGQARNNLYMTVKGWACYVLLADMLDKLGRSDEAGSARHSAALAATSVVAEWNDELGFIPAVFEKDNHSAIIPAIEGLIYPWACGLHQAVADDGPYAELIAILKRHFTAVFKSGLCQYDDGGWKLSSTADNSWMSKICLCQHVARAILGCTWDDDEQLRQDRAHADWQRIGAADHACSDQFHSGVAKGSLYYPRIVTSVLWLEPQRK